MNLRGPTYPRAVQSSFNQKINYRTNNFNLYPISTRIRFTMDHRFIYRSKLRRLTFSFSPFWILWGLGKIHFGENPINKLIIKYLRRSSIGLNSIKNKKIKKTLTFKGVSSRLERTHQEFNKGNEWFVCTLNHFRNPYIHHDISVLLLHYGHYRPCLLSFACTASRMANRTRCYSSEEHFHGVTPKRKGCLGLLTAQF